MSEIIRDFFHTDWSAMTRADWSGLVIVVVLTVLMTALYVWILKPSNKDKFEQYRDFVIQDDEKEGISREVEHGKAK